MGISRGEHESALYGNAASLAFRWVAWRTRAQVPSSARSRANHWRRPCARDREWTNIAVQGHCSSEVTLRGSTTIPIGLIAAEVGPRPAQRALARDFSPDRRELSGDRRAGRLAQPVAHHRRCRCRRPRCATSCRISSSSGLIYAPHTSAGRLPTELGLRFFVDALMQIGDLTEHDRSAIEGQVAAVGQAKSVEAVLTEASGLLSGLTPRRRRRADREIQFAAQAHRIRPARARTGAGGAGRPRTARSRTASSTCRSGCRPRR